MRQHKLTLVYGFAIFAMFFGSGNLVFPLQIGNASGNNWVFGFVGLLLTGILLPLMGLFVIKRYHGNYQHFFGEAGDIAAVFLPLIMLSLLGSFGVVPRCITVAFGSVSYLFPQMTLAPFSLFFCVLTFFFCLNDKIMVKLLGKWMSPILLLTLVGLIAMAMLKAPDSQQAITVHAALSNGFLTGYQTMDLFAAFFFSSLIFQQIQRELPNASNQEIVRFAIKPSILGAGLLALIYSGLVYLGAHYSFLINTIKPELMLPTIAEWAIGGQATLIMAVTMFFSCLTTAVALNNLFARYLWSTFHCQNNKFPWILLITTSLSFIISLLDFKGIAAFLSPILHLTYPGIIALTAMCLCLRGHKRFKTMMFYLITVILGGATLLHLAN